MHSILKPKTIVGRLRTGDSVISLTKTLRHPYRFRIQDCHDRASQHMGQLDVRREGRVSRDGVLSRTGSTGKAVEAHQRQSVPQREAGSHSFYKVRLNVVDQTKV